MSPRGCRPFIACVLALTFDVGSARADEKDAGGAAQPATETAKPVSDAERKRRERRLVDAARRWWTQRRRLVASCSQCYGTGHVHWQRGSSVCPKCDGRKRVVSEAVHRRLHWEAMSPAYRALPGSRRAQQERHARENVGHPWPEAVERFRVLPDVEWASDRHAVVGVQVDDEAAPRPQRWFLAEDRDGEERWFLFDEGGADGPWPGGSLAAASLPAAASLRPLPAEERAVLERRFEAAKISWSLVEASRGRDEVLVLVFVPRPRVGTVAARGTRAHDGLSVMRAIFSGTGCPWRTVHTVWQHRWRNELGQVETRVHAVGAMTKDKHDRVVWSNLTVDERAALLDWKEESYEGWIPWDPPPGGASGG
jgi:hypothetical protein